MESDPPDQEFWDFAGPEPSWQEEWQKFLAATLKRRQLLGNGKDGYQAAREIDAIDESVQAGRVEDLGN